LELDFVSGEGLFPFISDDADLSLGELEFGKVANQTDTLFRGCGLFQGWGDLIGGLVFLHDAYSYSVLQRTWFWQCLNRQGSGAALDARDFAAAASGISVGMDGLIRLGRRVVRTGLCETVG